MPVKPGGAPKQGMEAMFQWCKNVTQGYEGVEVTNFTTSWGIYLYKK